MGAVSRRSIGIVLILLIYFSAFYQRPLHTTRRMTFSPGLAGVLQITISDLSVVDREQLSEIANDDLPLPAPALVRPLIYTQELIDDRSRIPIAVCYPPPEAPRYIYVLSGRLRLDLQLSPGDGLWLLDGYRRTDNRRTLEEVCLFQTADTHPVIGRDFRFALWGRPVWFPLDSYRVLLGTKLLRLSGQRDLGLQDLVVVVDAELQDFGLARAPELVKIDDEGDSASLYVPLYFVRPWWTRLLYLAPSATAVIALLLAISGQMPVWLLGLAVPLLGALGVGRVAPASTGVLWWAFPLVIVVSAIAAMLLAGEGRLKDVLNGARHARGGARGERGGKPSRRRQRHRR